MKGILFAGIAVAFFVLAWMFLRLAGVFSTTQRAIKDISEQVVPLIGKTHVTVDNINSQLGTLDEAVGDVAGITDELDQTTTVIPRAVLGAAGALYATNEDFRKALPERARGLPVAVRRRFETAAAAAREASELRR